MKFDNLPKSAVPPFSRRPKQLQSLDFHFHFFIFSQKSSQKFLVEVTLKIGDRKNQLQDF
jgi:hypothetical protein